MGDEHSTKRRINLWLDDHRQPPSNAREQWTWARTADEAIELLNTLQVEFASLDHDLTEEHHQTYLRAYITGEPVDTSGCAQKTGLDVLLWMDQHNVWPKGGVRIHSMNSYRKADMVSLVEKHYGRSYQY